MALRFFTGFDFCNTTSNLKLAILAALGGVGSDVPNGALNAGGGRFGGDAWLTNSGNTVLFAFGGTQATWVVGTAVKFPALPGSDSAFIEFLDNGTTQIDIRVTSTGAIRITRNGTSLAVSADAVISASLYYHIEAKVTIADAGGAVDVHVDGVSKVSASGADTKNTANAYADQIRLKGTINGQLWDDLHILDGSGGSNNDFLGECRVERILPGSAGDTTQWTPSAGSNFQNVDETAPNSDTDYNSDGTVGDIDLYNYANTSVTGSVVAAQSYMYARKDDAGTREIAAVCKSGATTDVGATKTLTSSYQYYHKLYETDPNTGAAWTISNIDSAQFGVKVIT